MERSHNIDSTQHRKHQAQIFFEWRDHRDDGVQFPDENNYWQGGLAGGVHCGDGGTGGGNRKITPFSDSKKVVIIMKPTLTKHLAFCATTLLLSGCFASSSSMDDNRSATVLNTTSSGVGVVFVAYEDVDLPYSTMGGLFTKHVATGTFLRGTRVLQTSKTWKGDILWKLCGEIVANGPQQELIVADVSWKNGMIEGTYNGLSPVPTVVPSFMRVTHGHVDLSGASQDDLFHATGDSDWIIRYYAYKELIQRKNITPELRTVLEQGEKDPVDIVKDVAFCGLWDLYLAENFSRSIKR
jgi:hypothetical protein